MRLMLVSRFSDFPISEYPSHLSSNAATHGSRSTPWKIDVAFLKEVQES